jgi:sortase A
VKLKIISIIMIAAGITVLSYPTLAEEYHDYQQQKLVKEWQNSLQNIHNGEETPASTGAPVAAANEDEEKEAPVVVESKKETEKKVVPDFSQHKNMEGLLTINKIDLMLPILHGATDANMKTTVASIEDTGKAGEVGNYAIAGHRNFTYGRNFNRLDEMSVGDKLQVNNGDVEFEYTVTEKLYVKPEDIWVLEANGKDKEITLITCHPMENPTHRLIIKGKITD